MNKNKILKILLVLSIIYLIFPLCTKALTVKNNLMWTDELGLKNVTYNTKNWSGSSRETKYIGGFSVDGSRVFCVQPGQTYTAGATYTGKYNNISASVAKSLVEKHSTHAKNKSWTLPVESINKVNSCYYTLDDVGTSKKKNHYASVVAAQAIIWEFVTGERTNFNSIEPNKKVTTNSLYSRIKAGVLSNGKTDSTVYNEYQNIIKCGKRFGYTPDEASSTKKNHELIYSPSSDKFSYEFIPNKTTLIDSSLKYYEIYIDGTKCSNTSTTKKGITCNCNTTKCTFTSTTENISNVNVTFKYAYKANGKSLGTTSQAYYSDKTSAVDGAMQLLMKGSASKEFNIVLSTGTKPRYAFKFTKKDRHGKVVQGAQFKLYNSDKKTEVSKNLTLESDSKGVVLYDQLLSSGTYYLKEISTTPNLIKYDGYIALKVTDKNTSSNPAIPENVTENGKDWVKNGIVYNDGLILRMLKRTYDEEGNEVEIQDYCVVKTCSDGTENGPVFEITSDNKKVCIKKYSDSDAGKYDFSSLSTSCNPDIETSEIRTCNGSFDISNMPAGTYVVAEKKAPCNVQLDNNPTKTVVVSNTTPVTSVTFENGLTGIVFHKVDESGNLISGGKFSLQKKENGIYKDIGLRSLGSSGGYENGKIWTNLTNSVTYTYDDTVTPTPFETFDGIINIIGLPIGEYRIVEKEAPEGYAIIKDKNSTAIFTISDKSSSEYKVVELINRKEQAAGSSDSAELIVTIITGRKVVNYVFIIIGLGALLGALIYLRKRIKK